MMIKIEDIKKIEQPKVEIPCGICGSSPNKQCVHCKGTGRVTRFLTQDELLLWIWS